MGFGKLQRGLRVHLAAHHRFQVTLGLKHIEKKGVVPLLDYLDYSRIIKLAGLAPMKVTAYKHSFDPHK